MPLRLDVKRTLTARSDRSKSVDLHPTEPWLLVCLYNGTVNIWNTESQTLIKTFEVYELPVRCGKFVARKNWVVTGSDDLHINVWNYNTLEKVHGFEAHSDYLRCLQVSDGIRYPSLIFDYDQLLQLYLITLILINNLTNQSKIESIDQSINRSTDQLVMILIDQIFGSQPINRQSTKTNRFTLHS